MTENKKPTLEGKLVEGEKYTCQMVFTTVGDSEGVGMTYEYSHDFPDDYEGDVPAAYIAMRDTAIMLTRMVQMREQAEKNDKANAILELGDGLTENNTTH